MTRDVIDGVRAIVPSLVGWFGFALVVGRARVCVYTYILFTTSSYITNDRHVCEYYINAKESKKAKQMRMY